MSNVSTNETRQLSVEDVNELFEEIRTTATRAAHSFEGGLSDLDRMAEMIIKVHHGKLWKIATQFTTWKMFCGEEFKEVQTLKIPVSTREEFHKKLREGGLSIRDIAAVTTTNKDTVNKDLSESGTKSRRGGPVAYRAETIGKLIYGYVAERLEADIEDGVLTADQAMTVRAAAEILYEVHKISEAEAAKKVAA